jgi:hypothetical protein
MGDLKFLDRSIHRSNGLLPHEPYEDMTVAKDHDPFQLLTATEQMTKQTQVAMENYFGWLQKSMSTFPWSNTNLNRILLSNATQNMAATFGYMQKLGQAKNLQEVVQIQTEFMETQMKSFNDQARVLSEIYAKAATDAMKGST